MRHMTMLMMSGMLAASLLAGCNDNPTTAPTTGGGTQTPPATPPATPPTTPPTTPPAAPNTAAVTVGDIFFQSNLNGSRNPAVDTVAAGGTVTWTWGGSESLPHSIQSMGSPSFTSSGIQTGPGQTYQFTFSTPGSYQYDCAVHGLMMTGTIVVLPAAGTDSTTTPPPATPAPAPAPPSTPTGY